MLGMIAAGLTIGLAAGLKPGALGVYVIHQTLSKGIKHGFLTSLAPFITDGPIILLSVFVTREIEDINWLVGSISLAGSAYLLLIAFRILRTRTQEALQPTADNGQSSLMGAIKLNALNPAPYIFWFSIGGAFIQNASTAGAWAFVLSLSCAICLTKFLVAVAVKSLGDQFSSKAYGYMIKLLAIPLIIFSGHLLYSGINIWLA